MFLFYPPTQADLVIVPFAAHIDYMGRKRSSVSPRACSQIKKVRLNSERHMPSLCRHILVMCLCLVGFFCSLFRHIGETAQLLIVKKAGHAINIEKPKRLCKLMKSFFMDQPLPQSQSASNGNDKK